MVTDDNLNPNDIRSKHKKWLSEGVTKWNRRRHKTKFAPQLQGVDVGGIVRGYSDSGRVEPIDLSEIDLCDADLTRAKMEFCILDNAKFRGANLTQTHFYRSRIVGADLRGATLNSTYFDDVKCFRSKLPFGGLSDAILFHGPLHYPQRTYNPFVGEIESVTQFLEFFNDNQDKINREGFTAYYRGHRDATWKLEPRVFRGPLVKDLETRLLTDLISSRPGDFRAMDSLLSRLVTAQHHGLPTRLLDVTSNPFVGLYFAAQDNTRDGAVHLFETNNKIVKPFNSDTIRVLCGLAALGDADEMRLVGIGLEDDRILESVLDSLTAHGDFRWEESMQRLLVEIAKEGSHFEDRIEPVDFYKVFIVKPEQNTARSQAQSGAALISGYHRRFERNLVLRETPGIDLYDHYVLTLKASNKGSIRDELMRLRVSKDTLFPGLDSSADRIRENYGID